MTSVTLKNSSIATVRTNGYTFDNASQVATTTLDSVTTNYGYDDIGQLTSESRSGYSGSYTYDANGNRVTRTVGGVTEDYAYDDADKLATVKISGVTQKSYGYDSAGRTTSVVTGGGTTTVAYDYEGRITTITYPSTATNTFTYNGLDTRVSKVDSGGTSTFKRDGAGVTAPVLGDGAAVYTPGVSERRSSTTTFMHSGIKNTDSQTGTGQTIAATKQYDAFGNVLTSTGTWKGPFSYAGSFGYQEDADSSLKLLGHRYYDPSIGRFLTRDPAKNGRNWYSYCCGNPVTSADPVGYRAWFFGFGLGGMFLFGGAGVSVGILKDFETGHWAFAGGGEFGQGVGIGGGPSGVIGIEDDVNLGGGIEDWGGEDFDKFVQVSVGPVAVSTDVDDNGNVTGIGGGWEIGGGPKGFGTIGGASELTWISPTAIWETGKEGISNLWNWAYNKLKSVSKYAV